MRWLLALSLLVHAAHAAFCFDSSGKTVVETSSSARGCIVTKDLGTGLVQFTLFSAAKGWFGFGVSSVADTQQMGPADVVVVYNDQTGVPQARSFLTGPAPTIKANPAKPWSKTNLNGTAPAWASIAISVTRPVAASADGVPLSIGLEATPNTFIFSWSDQVLIFGENGAIGLTPHGANRYGVKGRIMMGASGIIALPAGMSRATMILIHALIMCISLVLLPPIGIFFAMYMRERMGSSWVSVHIGIMVGGVGLLSIIGATLAFLFKPGSPFSSLHHIMGVAIIVLILAQIVMGFVAKAGYSPIASTSPIMTQVHRYFGFLLYVIIIPVQIYFGFSEYKTALGITAPMYLIAVPAVFGVIGIAMLLTGFFVLPYGDSGFNASPGANGGIPNTYPVKPSQREFLPLEEPKSPMSANGYGGGAGAASYGGSQGNSRNGRAAAGYNYGGGGMNGDGSHNNGVTRNGSQSGYKAPNDYYSNPQQPQQPQHSNNGYYAAQHQQQQQYQPQQQHQQLQQQQQPQQFHQEAAGYYDYNAQQLQLQQQQQQQQLQKLQSGREHARPAPAPTSQAPEYEYKPRSANSSRNHAAAATSGAAGAPGAPVGSGNSREYNGSRVRGQSQSRTRAAAAEEF
ncbi:hypothetical protein HDU81_008253 [Chytriomyces hyalinus]|nr:hypothetical protein HDU81_008253 [Chytriomyces hyalinus]